MTTTGTNFDDISNTDDDTDDGGSWYYIYSSIYYVCVCYKFGIISIAVYIMCVYVINLVVYL